MANLIHLRGLIFTSLFVLLFVYDTMSHRQNVQDMKVSNSTQENFVNSANHFSLSFLKYYPKLEKNVVVSPLSIYLVLDMIMIGVTKQISIEWQLKRDLIKFHDVKIEQFEDKYPEQANLHNKINNWVSSKTANQIKNIVSEEQTKNADPVFVNENIALTSSVKIKREPEDDGNDVAF